MAIPMDNAKAPIAVIDASPDFKPAYTTPTAIPSGILCSATASTMVVVFFRLLFGPSGALLFIWRCGITWSRISRNNIPSQKPTTGAINDSFHICSDFSRAGIIRLHTDAATMTPAAKPARDL